MKFTRKILSEIDRELGGLSYDANDRNNLSAALFDISIDHAKSTIHLLANNIYSSAYALTRPMFESFVRAAWLQHCASEDQIRKIIKKDAFPLNFGEMLEEIEKTRGWSEILSKIKKAAISNMHSYTHGGMQIIARRFSKSTLIHLPDKAEIDELCKFVAMMSFLSFNEIAQICCTEEKNEFIERLYATIEQEYFN